MKKTIIFTVSAMALFSVTGCLSSGSKNSRAPDEFRVVTKAPLTVPPEYKLRPPAAGTTLPAEVDASRVGVASAFGTNIGKNASPAERALVKSAEAQSVSPLIRSQIDYEEVRTIRKNKSVVDRVLFWRSDNSEDVAKSMDDNATGGQAVTIERANAKPRLKLPGT